MNHSLILKLGAVVAAVFGVALVLAPNQLVAMYQAPEMNATGVYNSMLYGAYLIGLAIMNWAASNASAERARYVILGNCAGAMVALLVAIARQMQATAVQLGWINVAIFAVLALLFGYLYFARSSAAGTAEAGAR